MNRKKGPGLFKRIIEEARDLSPEERAVVLENSTELAQIHQTCAQDGQTHVPDINEDVDLHFITFIVADNHLYELDGRKVFPINHGKCTDLVEASVQASNVFSYS